MMKKSVSLAEFSNTPTVSVMRDKTGANLAEREATNAVRTNAAMNQQGDDKETQQKGKPDEELFAME